MTFLQEKKSARENKKSHSDGSYFGGGNNHGYVGNNQNNNSNNLQQLTTNSNSLGELWLLDRNESTSAYKVLARTQGRTESNKQIQTKLADNNRSRYHRVKCGFKSTAATTDIGGRQPSAWSKREPTVGHEVVLLHRRVGAQDSRLQREEKTRPAEVGIIVLQSNLSTSDVLIPLFCSKPIPIHIQCANAGTDTCRIHIQYSTSFSKIILYLQKGN